MSIALQEALNSAQLNSTDIGYINAHGTATERGDIAESSATYAVFGKATPISSLKSYIGHTLGACGAIEAYISLQMMQQNWFCPTLNLTEIDPLCAPLDYIQSTGREIKTNYIMSNNFAFGGINTALIFKRWVD
jgi:3-oxoacyl-[acyl-carrier-protein] synthase II